MSCRLIEPVVDSYGRTDLPTSLIRAGRPFLPAAERQLEPSLRSAAVRLTSGSRDAVMLPELPLPVGVPDMTAVVLNKGAVSRRIATGVPPILGFRKSAVVAACGARKPTTLQRLMAVTGVSERQTRDTVGDLVRSGALIRSGSGWCRSEVIAPIGRVFALEAKVSDWRGGFAQSLKYSLYADSVTLVLGRIGSKAIDAARGACADQGVGLVVDGTWLVRPRLHKVPLARRLQCSEQILAVLVHQAI